jgi:hypothetical protein
VGLEVGKEGRLSEEMWQLQNVDIIESLSDSWRQFSFKAKILHL